jgi:hypothetical protein
MAIILNSVTVNWQCFLIKEPYCYHLAPNLTQTYFIGFSSNLTFAEVQQFFLSKMTGPAFSSTTKPAKEEINVPIQPANDSVTKTSLLYQKIYLLLLSIGLIVTYSAYDVVVHSIGEMLNGYNGSYQYHLIFLITSLVFPINWIVAKGMYD